MAASRANNNEVVMAAMAGQLLVMETGLVKEMARQCCISGVLQRFEDKEGWIDGEK